MSKSYVEVDDLFDFGETLALGREDREPEDPVEWIVGNFIDPITNTRMVLQEFQGRIIKEATKRNSDGRCQYDCVIWSQPKKSGKTTIAAAIGAWVACEVEAPNEVLCLANDKEQSAGRIFENLIPTLESKGWEIPESEKSRKRNPICFGPNRSVVKAITTDFRKEAGSNQGITLWSELWAYNRESLRLLWDEMTPPPTRKYGQRWVETYAGFIGQSLLLQEYYLKVFKDFDEKEIQEGVNKLWEDLPVYRLNDHILVFWDHDHRMPWQDERYYIQQKEGMRPNSYTRLHDNKWVDSTETFITHEQYDRSLKQHMGNKERATYALDGSRNGASTSLVGCVRKGGLVKTTDVEIWEPSGERNEIEYSSVAQTILRKWKMGLLKPPLYYDPYECLKLAQDLRAQGLNCEEFKQGTDRILADTLLGRLYKDGEISNPPHPKLKTHILGAKSEDKGDYKIRIIKSKANKAKDDEESIDVDACIAQSMAAYKAYQVKSGGWGASGV